MIPESSIYKPNLLKLSTVLVSGLDLFTHERGITKRYFTAHFRPYFGSLSR
jgi:hypothetical protein